MREKNFLSERGKWENFLTRINNFLKVQYFSRDCLCVKVLVGILLLFSHRSCAWMVRKMFIHRRMWNVKIIEFFLAHISLLFITTTNTLAQLSFMKKFPRERAEENGNKNCWTKFFILDSLILLILCIIQAENSVLVSELTNNKKFFEWERKTEEKLGKISHNVQLENCRHTI